MQCATRLEKYFEKEIGKMGRQNQNETEELCKKNFDEEIDLFHDQYQEAFVRQIIPVI